MPDNTAIAQSIVLAAEMQRFARGRWQQEVPAQSGRFATATRDRYPGPDVEVAVLGDHGNSIRRVFVHGQVATWPGWFWSQPYPELPAPPEWVNDHE